MDSSKQDIAAPGMKHWLFQVVPPLLMLIFLFASKSGPAVAFLLGILLIPFFISVISIIIKLFRFNKKKRFLLRPVLTIVIFFFMMAMVRMTFDIALEKATRNAMVIADECNRMISCPELPSGWEQDGIMVKKRFQGGWLQFLASYHHRPDEFVIHMYLMTDVGEVITGGLDKPVQVQPYKENQPMAKQ